MVQLFEKVPALTALAPHQSEPPFVFTQIVVMRFFIGIGAGVPAEVSAPFLVLARGLVARW